MNSQYGLVFCPRSGKSEGNEQLLDKLFNTGFLGEPFSLQYEGQSKQQTGYLTGENFLKLITFLGCSPQLAVVPPNEYSQWHHFCHIEIQQHQSPRYYKGLKHSKCSCPQCQSRVSKVLPDLAQWSPGSLQLVCPKCQQKTLVEDLSWRHSAGFGSLFIIIHSIYPSEAVPSDRLMELLNSGPFQDWDYFYYE